MRRVFGEVLGIFASSARLYLRDGHEEVSWVIGESVEQAEGSLRAGDHS